jgi:hypothetical protein
MDKVNIAKEEAISLRKQGLSLKEIVKKVQRPQSTISGWIKKVELTEEQKKYLDSRNPAKNILLQNRVEAIKKSIITWMERRKKYQEEGRELCREAIKNKDINFIVGIILYWTEGARSNNRNSVKFSNTDVAMVTLFTNFMKTYFNVEDTDICLKMYCWLNNGVSLTEIENFWIEKLNLNKSNLRKSYIEQDRKITGKKKNIHVYGVCNISINRTDIIQKIYGAIQEFTGINRPEWLF